MEAKARVRQPKKFNEDSKVNHLFDQNDVDSDDSVDNRTTNDVNRSKHVPDFLRNVEPAADGKRRREVKVVDVKD